MANASEDFGFSRPNVAHVARRQLTLSAALLALVGFATLGVTYAGRAPTAAPAASAKFERVVPNHAAQKPERIVSSVRPG